VGAHDRDHPSGLRGSDAEARSDGLADAGGLVEPGCAWKRHTTPKATLSVKVVLGCRAKRGI